MGAYPLLKANKLRSRFYNRVIKFDVSCFCEVGAYEASASIFVSNKLSKCEIFAFEANPYNYEKFKHLFGNYIHKAVSDEVGLVDFYLQKNHAKDIGNNSLLKRQGALSDNYYNKVQVPCDTLDNLVYNKNRRYALWIDVEGKGYEVLKKASKVLKNTDCILIEVESLKHWDNQKIDTDIINLLSDAGFKIDAYDDEYSSQYNILFIKK